MIAYIGQVSRGAKKLPALEAAGIRELTNRGQAPPVRRPFALDNGAFQDWKQERPFDGKAFLHDVEICAPLRPDFIVIPDIVAAGLDSLSFSHSWVPQLRSLAPSTPLYLAVQDGMELSHVAAFPHRIQGIFVGGSRPWKYDTAKQWITWAHEQGYLVHIGAIGSLKGVRWARQLGADSIDSNGPLLFERSFALYLQGVTEMELPSQTITWTEKEKHRTAPPMPKRRASKQAEGPGDPETIGARFELEVADRNPTPEQLRILRAIAPELAQEFEILWGLYALEDPELLSIPKPREYNRILQGMDLLSNRNQHLWCCDAAEAVLPFYEAVYPTDVRPRRFLREARAYAEGKLSRAEFLRLSQEVRLFSRNLNNLKQFGLHKGLGALYSIVALYSCFHQRIEIYQLGRGAQEKDQDFSWVTAGDMEFQATFEEALAQMSWKEKLHDKAVDIVRAKSRIPFEKEHQTWIQRHLPQVPIQGKILEKINNEVTERQVERLRSYLAKQQSVRGLSAKKKGKSRGKVGALPRERDLVLRAMQDPTTPPDEIRDALLAYRDDIAIVQAIAQNPMTPWDVLTDYWLLSQAPNEMLENPSLPLLLLESPSLFADWVRETIRDPRLERIRSNLGLQYKKWSLSNRLQWRPTLGVINRNAALRRAFFGKERCRLHFGKPVFLCKNNLEYLSFDDITIYDTGLVQQGTLSDFDPVLYENLAGFMETQQSQCPSDPMTFADTFVRQATKVEGDWRPFVSRVGGRKKKGRTRVGGKAEEAYAQQLAASEDPNTPSEELVNLFYAGPREIKQRVVQNPNLEAKQWKILADSYPDSAIVNPSLPLWILEDPNFWHGAAYTTFNAYAREHAPTRAIEERKADPSLVASFRMRIEAPSALRIYDNGWVEAFYPKQNKVFWFLDFSVFQEWFFEQMSDGEFRSIAKAYPPL